MNLDGLLRLLEERGLSVLVRQGGRTFLRGNKDDVSPQLLAMLDEFRDEILERFPPEPEPAPADAVQRPTMTRRILLVEDGRETVLREFAPGPEWEVFEEERTKHPGKLLWMQAWRNVFGDEQWVTFARTGD